MKNTPLSESLTTLHREQIRLRVILALVLLIAVVCFALLISWLGRDSPLTPLLAVRTSLFALLGVYGVGLGVSWIYARWIRVHRDPKVRELTETR